MLEVVAAIIWKDDKFLICRRPPEKARGLLWEFPGGKVEKEETKQQALIRECFEELSINLSVGDVFTDIIHEYADLTIHLTFFNATIKSGVPKALEHCDLRWISPAEVFQYKFCDADMQIAQTIFNANK